MALQLHCDYCDEVIANPDIAITVSKKGTEDTTFGSFDHASKWTAQFAESEEDG